MNSLPMVVADRDKFHAICQNLSLLGTPEHESLQIYQNNSEQCCYPVTFIRSWYDINELDSKVVDFAITFFEKNLGRLAEESHPHELLTKLEPLLKHADEKNRIHVLRQELFNLHSIKATERDRSLIIQESEQRAKDLENEAKQRVQELERQCTFLKNEIVNLEDTLIVCQDISLSWHLKKLCNVAFFHSHIQHEKMEKSSLTDEEKKHYKHKFDFSEFHSKTVMTLVEWLDDPKKIINIKDFNALYELYRLADYVNDAAFRTDCLKVIEKQLTDDNKLQILGIAEYSSGDDLITLCCTHVINNFKHLKTHPKFLEIRPEYFLKIIQDEKILIDNAEELFYAILAWAEVIAKQSDTTTMDVLYNDIEGHRLMDCMPLGSISKDFFTEKVLPLKILSDEDIIQWLQFHIRGKTQPLTNFYMFKCAQIDDHKTQITWNIPLEVFSNIGQWVENSTVREFLSNENSWRLSLGKFLNNMRFSLRIYNITRDFEFFLDVGNIQLYTGIKYLPELVDFQNKGVFKNPDRFVKGVDINLKRIDALDLKQGYVPLKILLYLKDTPPPTVQ